MNNRTEGTDSPNRPTGAIDRTLPQCPDRAWCDVPGRHDGEHSGEADLPKITATGFRGDFVDVIDPDGIAVPEVYALLVEHEESNTFDHFEIVLGIVKPDGDHATGHLTIREAGLLVKALAELIAVARSPQ